jgi:hypothetical protein
MIIFGPLGLHLLSVTMCIMGEGGSDILVEGFHC